MNNVIKASELFGAVMGGFFGLFIITLVLMTMNAEIPNIHPITFVLVSGVISILSTIAGFFSIRA